MTLKGPFSSKICCGNELDIILVKIMSSKIFHIMASFIKENIYKKNKSYIFLKLYFKEMIKYNYY